VIGGVVIGAIGRVVRGAIEQIINQDNSLTNWKQKKNVQFVMYIPNDYEKVGYKVFYGYDQIVL